MNMKFRILSVLLILSSSIAWAYVPPSQYLVKMFVNKKVGTKLVRVRTNLSSLPSADIKLKTLSLYDSTSHILRTWILDERDQKLYKMDRRANEMTPVGEMLFNGNFVEVTAALTKAGIPIKTEEELLKLTDEDQRRAAESQSLRRWRGVPAWIIGVPEKTDPQLWIEKDSFLPIRLLASYDVQFEGYGFFHGFPYPKTVSVLSTEGKPTMKEELVEFTTGATFPEMKGNAGPNGYTDLGNSASGSMRELIEAYFKVLR